MKPARSGISKWLLWVLSLIIPVVQLHRAEASSVAIWGYYMSGLPTDVPADLTNAVAITAGESYSVVLNANGTVTSWGINSITNLPADLTNVSAVVGGYEHCLALKSDSSVESWGGGASVPPGLSNVIVLAAGVYDNLALTANGSVTIWGNVFYYPPGDLSDVVSLAVGFDHYVALLGDGTVRTWGDNSFGQTSVPPGLTNIVAISAGDYDTMALRADGTVLAWGSIFDGGPNWVPVTVPPNITNMVAIAAGPNHCLALARDGTATAWGAYYDYYSSYVAASVPAGLSNIVAIAAGANHDLALMGDGPPLVGLLIDRSVAGWRSTAFRASAVGEWPLTYQWQFNGTNIPGATNSILLLANLLQSQTGVYSVSVSNRWGTTTSPGAWLTVLTPVIQISPTNVVVPLAGTVTLSANIQADAALSYQWQFNGVDIPSATNSTLTISNVTASGNYSFKVSNGIETMQSATALVHLTTVIAWGQNNDGETDVPLDLTNAVSVGAGYFHSLAVRTDGTVIAWGANASGQTTVPQSCTNVTSVAGGVGHSLALRTDGTVVSWGDNSYGQTNVPIGASNIVAIAAGGYHNLALKTDGSVVAWGAGTNNSGSSFNYGQAIVPAGLTNVVAVACGYLHSLALRADGTVIAWGNNVTKQTNVPPTLGNVVGIGGGWANSAALRSNGSMVVWGDNSRHQTNVPPGLSNVVAFAAPQYTTLALKTDGTLTAWGATLGLSVVPGNAANMVQIAAGNSHVVALLNSGSPVAPWPVRTQQVVTGGEADLVVSTFGSPPLYYQWRFNGTNIENATNSVLVLTNTGFLAAGSYTCVVSNAFGATVSAPINLAVTRSISRFNTNLARPTLSAQGFKFQLDSLSGHGPVIVLVSSNLVDWIPVLTNEPVLGSLQLSDSSVTNVPVRYYRAIEQ